MNVKGLWYEISPYVYFVIGVASILFCTSDLGLLFCALLLSATGIIFRLRRIYRSPDEQHRRKYARPSVVR